MTNYFFCELLCLIVSGVGENESSLRALEVVVFEVGGEVEVGLRRDSIGKEIGACAAAQGDAMDLFLGVVEGGANGWLVCQFFYSQ